MNPLFDSAAPWSFPGCPEPPGWTIDWGALVGRYAWLAALAGCPQDPRHHAEGDVLTHTHMVAEALCGLPEWRALPPTERSVLFLAALLHDVAKPRCTIVEPGGRIAAPRHARVGERVARSLLWREPAAYGAIPFAYREQVAKLVRHHGLPVWFLDRPGYERAAVAASQTARLDRVALLAEADARGRICAEQGELLARVDLFRQACRELECLEAPRRFASDHARFVYFHTPHASLHHDAHDDTRGTATLLCGLPGTGKDTWIGREAPGTPVISLDALRAELGLAPGDPAGPVGRAGRERARPLLARGEPVIWNATNLSRPLRRQLIDFFAGYRARVRIVCLVAPLATTLQRNRGRGRQVPERVILRMLDSFDLPDATEAHEVRYVVSEG
jgi:predicted kinase